MSKLSQLIGLVQTLTSRLDDIQSNSKTFTELTEQTSLVSSSKIAVLNNGETETITVQQIINEGTVGQSLYLGAYASLTELTSAHPTPVVGARAIIIVVSSEDKIAFWDEGESIWFVQTPEVSVGGSDTFSITKNMSLTLNSTGFYFKAQLNNDGYKMVNLNTNQTTLAGLYSKHDIPSLINFPFDCKIESISVSNNMSRAETITMGVFSNERINNTAFYTATALNGQTLFENTMVSSGNQKQGIYNFNSGNGVLDVLIPTGASLYTVFKSNGGSTTARLLTVTINFKRV